MLCVVVSNTPEPNITQVESVQKRSAENVGQRVKRQENGKDMVTEGKKMIRVNLGLKMIRVGWKLHGLKHKTRRCWVGELHTKSSE